MDNVITGKVVNTIEFNIPKNSWRNLDLFQKRIAGLKKQLQGLDKTFVVTAKVDRFTRAVERSENRIAKAQSRRVTAEIKLAREQARIEAQQRRSIQGRWDLRRMARERREEDKVKIVNRLAQVKASPEEVNRVTNGMLKLNKQFANGTISLRKYNAELNNLIGSSQRVIRQHKAMSTSLSDVRNGIVAATASFTAYAAAANVFQEGKELESIRAGMALFTGGNDVKIEENMDFIRQASMDIGVNFLEAAKNFSKFQIVARNSMSQEQSRELFLGISEYARVVGATAPQQGRAFYALQQMMSKGRVSSEELRQQLSEQLVGSFDIFVKASGMTSNEFMKAMEQGLINSAELLPKVAAEYRKVARENGALAKAMQKVGAQQERFNTALTNTKDIIFRSGMSDGMTTLFQTLTHFLDKSQPFFKFIGGFMEGFIESMTVFTNIIGGAIQGLGKFFGLFSDNTIMNMGKVFGTGGALVLGAFTLYKLYKGFLFAAAGAKIFQVALSTILRKVLLILAPLLLIEDIIVGLNGGNSVSGAALKAVMDGSGIQKQAENPFRFLPSVALFDKVVQGGQQISIAIKDSEFAKFLDVTIMDKFNDTAKATMAAE